MDNIPQFDIICLDSFDGLQANEVKLLESWEFNGKKVKSANGKISDFDGDFEITLTDGTIIYCVYHHSINPYQRQDKKYYAYVTIGDTKIDIYKNDMFDESIGNWGSMFLGTLKYVQHLLVDLFEDCTTLRWVKWTNRTPDFNGSIYCRWNGKYTSTGIVSNGKLLNISGEKWTGAQKEFDTIMESVYWLEEIIDTEKYKKLTEE